MKLTSTSILLRTLGVKGMSNQADIEAIFDQYNDEGKTRLSKVW